ncbi:E3 ubiquitin-protein ligase CCNB1IP1-like [Leptodactylus fuscus]|uniref:E3 ubiquitin-protein ligase CCNB1IP1-like n=1 Tax=Leptodactylus fuscus TaxID=238119 RepID=UPI003F4F1DD9
MSACDDVLVCNFPKCRGKLSSRAWVTACSHIFCEQHGSGQFTRTPTVCPACNSTLSSRMDIKHTELNPAEEKKAIMLAGLRPEIVLDICSRALVFWTYQVYQERLYQEYRYSQAEGHLKQLEKHYTQQIQSKDSELLAMKGEVNSLKKILEEYKTKYSDLSEKLMERNRLYNKLQGLYDGLRLRHIAMSNREVSTSRERGRTGHAARTPPLQLSDDDCHTETLFPSPPFRDPRSTTHGSPEMRGDPQHLASSRGYRNARITRFPFCKTMMAGLKLIDLRKIKTTQQWKIHKARENTLNCSSLLNKFLIPDHGSMKA